MDITKPFAIIAPAMVSILVCDLFFHELDVATIFLGVAPLLIFAVLSTLLIHAFAAQKKLQPINMVIQGNFLIIIAAMTMVSFVASTYLVINFSRDFGFYSVFLRADLLQSNAITNSFGNFLYLNVLLFPIFLKLAIDNGPRLMFLICLVLSLFFLYFAGIKSYLFQSILLCGFIFLRGRGFSKIALTLLLLLSVLVLYFIFYDSHIDLAADSILESLGRFLAYFSGSWATFQSYLEDPLRSQYPALATFFPFYKIILGGDVALSDYLKFFTIEGFELNVVPLFQLSYLEGGWIFQCLVIMLSSFAYALIRKLALMRANNIFFQICHVYFCSTFIISSLFANVFGDLHVYISFAIVFLAAAALKVKNTSL